MKRVVVIGAGIGGLTAAAALARAGLDVTVLEAHIYPGGCAGTFYHQGYRFDAGATLAAGFYPGGPMDLVADATGISSWDVCPAPNAIQVHFPNGERVLLHGGESRWEERHAHFGAAGLTFWRWQENTAEAIWDLALRLPPWPPQTGIDFVQLFQIGRDWLAGQQGSQRTAALPDLVRDAFRPVSTHLQKAPDRQRLLVDAQLLISAQATSNQVMALYGASALDLPRRGVVHLPGGMGTIAENLAQALRSQGGKIFYRRRVDRIITRNGRPVAVETGRGDIFPADLVIANLTPWDLERLLDPAKDSYQEQHRSRPGDGWGAFVVYAGIQDPDLKPDFPLHHQVIQSEPLGETNSIFLSISPEWDLTRAPRGCRALTISSHTELRPWWQLYHQDRSTYEARKEAYTGRLLEAAGRIIPGLNARLVLPGTPVTFQRFAHRAMGWVGGFPQTNLFRTAPPRRLPGLWQVGDSIFPGQSTAAVALGGLRVAGMILRIIESRQEETGLALAIQNPKNLFPSKTVER